MGNVLDFSIGLPTSSPNHKKQTARLYHMPAKPTPGNPIIDAVFALDLKFKSGRSIARAGTRVKVEIGQGNSIFFIYDEKMKDIIYTMERLDDLFLYLDVSEEALDVIARENRDSSSVAAPGP